MFFLVISPPPPDGLFVFIAGSGAPSWAMGDIFPGGMEANYVRVIWRQMLQAVHAMHEQRVRGVGMEMGGTAGRNVFPEN